jgi:hypothetical protein
LQLEAKARAGMYRLYRSKKRKSKGYGLAYMSQGMKEDPVLQMGTDKTIQRHVYDKPFMVRCPEGS